MKSSAYKNLFKNYSPFIDSPTTLSLSYGKLYIDIDNKQIQVIDIYGIQHVVGNSVRYLSELKDFQDDDYNDGILQFIEINNEIVLSIQPILFSIWDLNGSNGISNADSYLGFKSNNNETYLTNIDSLVFNIQDLADVSNYSLDKSRDGWVLTSTLFTGRIYRPSTNIFKDALGEEIYYCWQLQPETSSIRYFDDTGRTIESDKQVYRIVKPNERKNYLYINHALDISYDDTPMLANSLDSATHSIYNVQQSTIQIDNSSSVITVNIDLLEQNVTFIDGENVSLVNIGVNIPSSLDTNMYSHAVIIEKFKGFIQVDSNCQVENGRLPISIGGDILLSIIATNYPTPIVRITQKTLNLL